MRKLFSIICTLLATAAMAQAPAFPGAEGHGRYVTGGRGGEVRHVTNLNDSGTGSFRAAVTGAAKKIIVFDVSGIIQLGSDLKIGDNTTIAGQTAPKGGITLRYYTVSPGKNNIIRFIRFRRGEEKDCNDGADAIWQRDVKDLILDHCSFSWSIDEIASFYDNNNFTMQWCALGEALANPGHSKGEHSYGGIWGGKLASFHHNFIAHVQNRAPRFCGARYASQNYDKTKYSNPIQAEIVDFRNCVMYNWGSGNGCYGGTGGGQINIVNNYYKAGPATVNRTRTTQISVATSSNASDSPYMGYCSRYYINGNYVTAAGDNAANYDWKGVSFDKGTSEINGERYCPDPNHYYGDNVVYTKNTDNVDCVKIKMDSPTATGEVTTHSAEMAYEKVLSYVGASLYRDDVDKRYANEARNGTTTYTGSAEETGGKTITHHPGIIDFVKDQGEYSIASQKRLSSFDTDQDGIPDDWEEANGLNPNDATDAKLFTLDDATKDGKGWYNNLEVYLNSLVEDIMKAGNADALTAVDEYYPAFTKPAEEPSTDPEGDITWDFDEGNEEKKSEISTFIEDGIASTSVTLGSDLAYNGKETSLNETKIQDCAMASTAASPNNTITFKVNIVDGYQFLATNFSVTATRLGTDAGNLDISWQDQKTTKIYTGVKPNRENSTQKYSTYSSSVEDYAEATEGSCSLIINMYGVTTGYKKDSNGQPTSEINYKAYGFRDILISGKLIAPTGIAVPVTLSPALTTEYFTLGGQRVNGATKGVVIKRQNYADGTSKTTKVIR